MGMILSDAEYQRWWDGLPEYDRYDVLERVESEVGWGESPKALASSFLARMKAGKPLTPRQIKAAHCWHGRQNFDQRVNR
jgi:hypothetical protein